MKERWSSRHSTLLKSIARTIRLIGKHKVSEAEEHLIRIEKVYANRDEPSRCISAEICIISRCLNAITDYLKKECKFKG